VLEYQLYHISTDGLLVHGGVGIVSKRGNKSIKYALSRIPSDNPNGHDYIHLLGLAISRLSVMR
jgi:hypothetical protein